MKVEDIKSGVIVLTSNAEIKAKLERKLAEYETRQDGFAHPGFAPLATYKREILAALLKNGRVDLEEMAAVYSNESWYAPEALLTAFVVVLSYNSGDTSLLVGGTGLK